MKEVLKGTGMSSKRGFIKSKSFFCVVFIVIVAFQYALCIHYGMKREYLFCDEVYSYGLANSTEHTFLHPRENDEPLEDWVSGSYFTDYMNYNDSSFNYKAAYVNQANDVHPPLYYMLLHTVCYFFKGAGYSVVPGLVLNLVLLIFVGLLLLYVASNLLRDKWYGLIATLFWGLSSVGISSCMLIRMYLLQTLEVLLLTAVHIYILKHRDRMTIPYFILLALAVMLGGLTHYYFYFYAAGLGICVCIYLLFTRQTKQMFAYGLSLVAGLVAAVAVFPATRDHIFGYRGSYATSNLVGVNISKFLSYIKYVNKAYFAGLIPLFVLAVFAILVWYIVTRFVEVRLSVTRDGDNRLFYRLTTERRDVNTCRAGYVDKQSLLFVAVVIGDAVLGFVGVQGSELVSARYIYSALPIFGVFVVWCVIKAASVFTKKYAVCWVAAICVFLCAGSIKVNGIDWMYESYSRQSEYVEEMKGQDCVILTHGKGKWNNIYAGVNVFSEMNRCRYVDEDDVKNIGSYLGDCGDTLYVAVVNDPAFDKHEIKRMVGQISKHTKYRHHDAGYRYAGIVIYKFTVDGKKSK